MGALGAHQAAGTSPLAVNQGGSTPLHWASTVQDASVCVPVIRTLADAGVSVHARNGAGETALHWAVDWRAEHAVNTLLDMGADPNAVDERGNTPLHKIKADCDQRDEYALAHAAAG
jgi:ankyrin repeat protein